ncbi:MAG TPA: ATP-binding cassette domain-containing protein [bacterium]|jgi:ABC-2 type transport system ATP-binding protein|nr:ATP-binding cassette domain-containing protein [bacterium]
MIEVSDLTKDYGTFKAVKGVSFSVQKGDILGFLGPNGAGKTTVMKILTCFLPSTGGRASVAGFDCEKEPEQVRRHLGYLPENNPLYLDMRVREFLSFAAHAKGIKGPQRRAAVDHSIEETGIESVTGRLIGQLSKGFRQRVGLAQALVGDPDVLILDEPTVGLDPRQILDIRKLIKSMAGRRTVILSTHILPEVSAVCDRVIIINKGLVIEQDSTANLGRRLAKSDRVQVSLTAPAEDARAFLGRLAKVKKVGVRSEADGVATLDVESTKGVDIRAALAQAVVEKGWGLLELKAMGLGLEEVFLQLVTQEGAPPEDGAESDEASTEVTE